MENAVNKDFILQHSVICFKGTTYPFLFFSLLTIKIKGFVHGSYRSIDLAQYELESIKKLVSMHFLGSSFIYWFGNVDELDAKKKKEFLSFIQTYTGPHSLCFFSESIEWKQKRGFDLITLPSTVDQKQFNDLYSYFFTLARAENVSMFNALFKKHDSIQLDAACLLMHYCSIMGRAHFNVFSQEWLDKFLIPEKSLFSLSTYLFAKKDRRVFYLMA